jgi:hypothetical protein
MRIPYWFRRCVEIERYKIEKRNNKSSIMITPMFKDKELTKRGYGEWFYRNWWLIDLPF